MDEAGSVICGGCCASICAQIQYAFCNTRQYGTDASCCDNCCRFNCGWKHGALPVEDYPVANSAAEGTQTVDATAAKGQDGLLPAYTATPQMTTVPPQTQTPATATS